MEIRFTQSKGDRWNFAPAVLLAAVLCSVFAALDWLSMLPFALAGVPIAAACGLFRQKKPVFYVLFGMLAAFFLLRFAFIIDGAKLLTNRMFSRSEMQQAYEYEYFETFGENPWEAVLFLSLLAGALCALWQSRFAGSLTAVWVLAMAYFGVTPGAFWLTLLGAACLLCAVPKKQMWFHGGMAALALIVIALLVGFLAPHPNPSLSALDDKLRDELAQHSIFYEQTVIPTEVPQPETQPTEPPPEEQPPNHGVENSPLNVLFIVLATLTAVLLFGQAIIKDRAEKRRQKNRAGITDPNHAAAIRAMYLYARRWRRLAAAPIPEPEPVRAIWLEAAYSEHPMTAGQRQVIYDDMKRTALSVWEAADWKKRLCIQYKIAL